MSLLDRAVDVTTALGRGIYSVGEDLVLGGQRTGQGLGLSQAGRAADIGYENRAMFGLLRRTLQAGVRSASSPLHVAITRILVRYFEHFPEPVLRALGREVGLASAYTAGRLVIGKKLAAHVATRVAAAIAISAAYKRLAKQLGVSAGAGATGMGAPIGLLMAQGVMQRASAAAQRLRMRAPTVYSDLQRAGDLQLLYFLLERPMSDYVEAIALAQRSAAEFRAALRRAYPEAMDAEASGATAP